jgi:hypothetical protein
MDDLTKTIISIAAAALVGLLVWLGVFNRPVGQEQVDPGNYNIERGTFVIQHNGRTVGQEDFVLSTTDVQINLNSTVTLNNGDAFTPQFRLSETWQPIRYFRNSHDAANRDTVIVDVSADQIRMNQFDGDQNRESIFSSEPPLILLDENVLSHYLILWEYIKTKPSGTATALLPSSLETAPITYTLTTTDTMSSNRRILSAQRDDVRVGDQTIFLYSVDGELIAVAHLNEQLFAYRSDLYPQGLQQR